MRILYILTSGTADPTKASLPVHLAVNGSTEIGDEPAIFMAGDGTEFLSENAIDQAQGVGVPSMRELFDKVRHHEIPVYV
jgi:predicted peroxiredoxin